MVVGLVWTTCKVSSNPSHSVILWLVTQASSTVSIKLSQSTPQPVPAHAHPTKNHQKSIWWGLALANVAVGYQGVPPQREQQWKALTERPRVLPSTCNKPNTHQALPPQTCGHQNLCQFHRFFYNLRRNANSQPSAPNCSFPQCAFCSRTKPGGYLHYCVLKRDEHVDRAP